jgi:hypothetical protein
LKEKGRDILMSNSMQGLFFQVGKPPQPSNKQQINERRISNVPTVGSPVI